MDDDDRHGDPGDQPSANEQALLECPSEEAGFGCTRRVADAQANPDDYVDWDEAYARTMKRLSS